MVDIKAFAKVVKGLPFWFAGSYGRKDKLCDALNGGGNSVQVRSLAINQFVFHICLKLTNSLLQSISAGRHIVRSG